MNDLINRHAAIELIERMKPYHQEADDIAEMIANMPSAQPELTQNLHNACTDLISRQKVIKLLDEAWVDGHEYQGWLHDEVNRLPSAQPNLQPTCNELATDVISRQAAIDAAREELESGTYFDIPSKIEALPSAQPVLDRTKISDLLEKIYSIQSVFLSVEGALARKYYCKQLWIELFGSEDVPKWID